MSGSDFWSRRRAAVEAEARAEAAEARADAEAATRQSLEEKSDAEVLAELNLPDPETLEAGDDFSGFLKSAVPDRLRRVALRRLWATNPVLANLDGLIEYGEDYTDAATVVENLSTAYQVGKGMTAHVEKMLAQASADVDETDMEEEEVADTGLDTREAAPEPEALEAEKTFETSPVQQDVEAENPEPTISYAKPRRMRYRFDRDEEANA